MVGLVLGLGGCTETTPPPADATPGCDGLGRSRCVDTVSLGGRFGCAALRDQTVWCWGRNDESQLGYESSDLCPERLSNGQTRAVACSRTPLQVVGLAGALAVSAGGAHACVRRVDGTAHCWGSNTRGQLGNGASLPSRAPVAVPGVEGVVSLAAGARHTCAVTEAGTVWCWGANDRGQLGVEAAPARCGDEGATVPCARTAQSVAGIWDAVEVTAGEAHTCVRTAAGGVRCWGDNVDGQLGAGTAGESPTATPQTVRLGEGTLRGVTNLVAGAAHTCALRDDGAVLCWGRHDRGQLGVPVPMRFEPCAHACIPTAVPITGYEGRTVKEDPDASLPPLDAALLDAPAPRDADAPRDRPAPVDAAADTDATVDGAMEAAMPDVPEAPAPTVVALSAGGAFSCLALSNGTVRCWGTNRAWELGNGRAQEGGPALTAVIASPGSAATNPLQDVRRIASGTATTCAVRADRGVRCWGSNESGALGVGDLSERNGPVPLTW